MIRKKTFRIVTLSDCLECEHKNLSGVVPPEPSQGGGMDPATIIMGGLAILQQFAPNLFGGGRRKLTPADWEQLFPGNGSWTVRLRNRLAATIQYDSDLGNIELFTRYFVVDNQAGICGAGVDFSTCYTKFLEILQEEKFTGGKSPVGRVPGYGGTIDYASLLPYAIGGVVLIYLMKKKK